MKNRMTMRRVFIYTMLMFIVFMLTATPTIMASASPFSDVDKASSHYNNIHEAFERKLINGYPDGTYRPNATLKRGHVTKILANYITENEGFATYDAYIDKHKILQVVTPFKDVSKQGDAELYKASLIVKFANVFNGSNNNLLPERGITREQMAKVLVNAFDLLPVANSQPTITDLHKAGGEFVPYIQILAENKVTIASIYNPKQSVTRGQIASFLNRAFDVAQGDSQKPVTPIEPSEGMEVTIGVQGIQLGESNQDVLRKFGTAQGVSANEFQTDWHAYHNHYKDFFMVSYDKGKKVNGLYTNSPLVTSSDGVQVGATKAVIRQKLGEPLKSIPFGDNYYGVSGNPLIDHYDIGNAYLFLLYDQHKNFRVDAIQIISKDLQHSRSTYYAPASTTLRNGFEAQQFDLTNAFRVKNGLPVLGHHGGLQKVARLHSDDMVINQFFSHTNLQGKSMADRVTGAGITWSYLAENISKGYYSSIMSHHGLVNSWGHRNNILSTEVTGLGVGVGFSEDNIPHFTEKYFRP